MVIWGTPVSGTQFFGYSIALSGLMYYKLGAEQIKQQVSNAGRSWQEFGNNRPALRKSIIFGSALLFVFILLGGLAPTYAPEQSQKLKDMLGQVGTGGGVIYSGSKGH